ncbi:TRAP transporter substrate-binding protein [Phytohabitans sp. LJ34]|uniref:TRAP transporter substrate-binding protein n=1 Tax=Phytohabitans sp. LJ34 TaxID=3452217 RepID=UPI003F89F3D1
MSVNRRTLIKAAGAAPLALAAPTHGRPRPPVTVRVATPFAAGHILADTALKFKEILEAGTRGRLVVEVATSVLNEQTINPAMAPCDPAERVADIVLTGGQPIQDYAPAYFFFNGPYVIRDYAHFQRVWRSHLGDEARALVRSGGNLVSLGTVYRGFRQFTANKEIVTPADLAGVKLRLPPVPDWVAVWSALGVVPVEVPLNGIYEALRTGVAEASEGDLTQISSLRLFEVQSHLALTGHLVGFGLVAANACFLRDVPWPHKVRAAMRAATDWGSRFMADREATLLTELAAAGMTVVTPDAAAIEAAAKPAIDQLFATRWNVTTWEEVLAL